MNHNDRFCPTAEIPARIHDAHPDCFALLTETPDQLAIVDPNLQPKADGRTLTYIIAGRQAFISRYIRIMGQIVLLNQGITLREDSAQIAGAVVALCEN